MRRSKTATRRPPLGPFEKPSMARHPYHLSKGATKNPGHLLWKILIFTRYLCLLDVDQMPCSISRGPDSSTSAGCRTRRHRVRVLAGPLLLTYIHRLIAWRPRGRSLLMSSKAAHRQRRSILPSDSERRGYEDTDGMTQKASQGEFPGRRHNRHNNKSPETFPRNGSTPHLCH